jgi:predicted TIM-barrel fold metal-dependent hydrolase
MDAPIVLNERPFAGMGNCVGRNPQRPARSTASLRIVSADDHLSLGGSDLWYDRAPPHLKDRVPRVWWEDGERYWVTGVGGKSLYPGGFAGHRIAYSMEGRPGAWNVDSRIADLDQEGVEKEIAFPQLLGAFFNWPDFEARAFIFRAYNEHLAALQQRQPGRFYGVGIANYWEPERAAESIAEITSLGLKTFMLPGMPGAFADGTPILYPEDAMAPLWRAIEAAGLPVCFHIGEQLVVTGRGAIMTTALNNLGGSYFRKLYGDLVFGGVFDRHPKLEIVFAEASLNWVPGLLQDADMVGESFAGLSDYTPALRPSDYWRRHCYATFMHDPAGLRLIDEIGIDRVMWSVDYPHNESTFGYSQTAIENVIAQVGIEAARKILGGTAIELFRL